MINEKRLLDTFIGYAMIDSETKNEKAMGEKLVEDLKALGLEVKTDKAGEGFGSNGFNVCAYLRERFRVSRRLCVRTWIP